MHRLMRIAAVLVLPLATLLFLQWPLRDWVHAYAPLANDLGQIVFALYVAVAVFAASRHGSHLAAGVGSHDEPLNPKPWRAWVTLLCVGPWAAFMLWASAATVKNAVLGLEQFAETASPGYFLVKMSLMVLLVLVLLDAVVTVWQSIQRSK